MLYIQKGGYIIIIVLRTTVFSVYLSNVFIYYVNIFWPNDCSGQGTQKEANVNGKLIYSVFG